MTTVDHFDLVVSDLERSRQFYADLLGPLGWTRWTSIDGERGEPVHYFGGEPPNRQIAMSLRQAQMNTHPIPYERYSVGIHHIAFKAPSWEAVDERYRWLLDNDVEIESPPQTYDYTEGYYAVFFYDPDGIKLEIVYKPGSHTG